VKDQSIHNSINKMLNPRSIAVIGATERQNYGGKFVSNILAYRDWLNLYAVNPRYDEVMGIKCYPNVRDLPEAPDVVAIVVPDKAVPQALEDCGARGVGSAIVISAGFSERGDEEGRARQRELRDLALSTGVRLTGPNCLGVVNLKSGIWLTSSTRPFSPVRGSVGLICQSGATLFGPLLDRAGDAQTGLSYAVSTGNEADLQFCDFADYFLDDPETNVIAGYVEGFQDGQRFIEIARKAAELDKPLVLIKIGRSQFGTRAASSHTAALTGADAFYDAVCAQYGVIRVDSYDQLLETSRLLATGRRIRGKGVAVVSHSGGVSSLTSDLLGDRGLILPQLSLTAQSRIAAILKGFGSPNNPADITGHAHRETFPIIARHLLGEAEVDTLVVASASNDRQADYVAELIAESPKNIVYLWTGSRHATPGLARLKSSGIPLFYSPEAVAGALRNLLDYSKARIRMAQNQLSTLPVLTQAQKQAIARVDQGTEKTLSEKEARELLAAWDITGPREAFATSADEAVAAAENIGYPVVLKAVSRDLPHKTEAGAVILSIRGPKELRAAHARITGSVAAYAPQAKIAGFSVQEMVTGGTEMIAGVTYDDQLGPILLFGTGGTAVEVLKDVSFRHCPISVEDARELVEEVKGIALLRGFRGAPHGDEPALIETLVRLSQMAAQVADHVAEIEVNPLVVLPAGRGVRALDALVYRRLPEGDA
jgi:acyl-CoA synthetase (NDP forming)